MNELVVALAGNPNAGKSCLFNALTGMTQKVANYPGVTVEKKMGYSVTPAGTKVSFLDLPGTYSLKPLTLDEKVAVDILNGENNHTQPDLVIAVSDATNLERTLGFVLELQASGRPVIMAMNMMDLATKRGLKFDLKKLELSLGCPVVGTVATHKKGVRDLVLSIDRFMPSIVKKKRLMENQPGFAREEFASRFDQVEAILKNCILIPTRVDEISRRIDRVVLHPLWGTVILGVVLLGMFQSIFTWAKPAQEFLQHAVESIGKLVQTQLAEGVLRDILTDGIIAGVGAVVVFLPQILLLFLWINIIEGSGYMARAAVILDQLMRRIGLQGKSFVPLLSSFACAIPGIMSTRTIRSERDRLITILIAPLMTCSARLPVYTLLIATFIPNWPILGPVRLQGLVMLGLFVVGIISACVVAWVLKHFAKNSEATSFLMELPSYKLPNLNYIVSSVFLRAKAFLYRAGTYILAISVVLWVLTNFPKPQAGDTRPAIQSSIAARLGNAIEPIFRPIGFDWRITTGLIPGLAAREVMVGALGTVFAVEATKEGQDKSISETNLSKKISETWSISTGLALLAWYVFAPQCLPTFATIRREANSKKWAFFAFFYMLVLAYVAAFLVFHVAKIL